MTLLSLTERLELGCKFYAEGAKAWLYNPISCKTVEFTNKEGLYKPNIESGANSDECAPISRPPWLGFAKGKKGSSKNNLRVLTFLLALLSLLGGIGGNGEKLAIAKGLSGSNNLIGSQVRVNKKVRVPKHKDSLLIHAKKGHPHDPLCDVCVHARMRGRQHRSLASDADIRGSNKGYVIGGDLIGPYTPDNDGNTDAMIGVEVGHTNYGMVELMQSSESSVTSESFKEMRRELKVMGDPSFKGDFSKYLLNETIEQTDTGGYNPQSNSRTERRIGLLKERTRAILFQCTAGLLYYNQLWGSALKHANYLVNRTEFSDGSVPYTKLTTKSYSKQVGAGLNDKRPASP